MEPERKGRVGSPKSKTHSFFRQEKLRLRGPGGLAPAPPHSNCLDDWSAARPEHIPSGQGSGRVAEWPLNTTFVSSRKKECLEATAHALFSEQTSPPAISPADRRAVRQRTSTYTALEHWGPQCETLGYPYLFKNTEWNVCIRANQVPEFSWQKY